MPKNLELKSISEILDKDFLIPSYQRGYRWESRQVEDLLEDILEFANNNSDGGFYCLQPIVVKQDENRYRVIDGQQRLTTILLILKLFNEVEFKRPKKVYSVSFDTRNSSQEYIQELKIDTKPTNENIDFYYLNRNYNLIHKWFNNKLHLEEDFIQRLYPILINDVKVIWYEIDNKEDEIDVFTRLNIGKIPLTNAELIKALFLLKMKDENEKILLASQWDEIEYKLQNDTFFGFLNSIIPQQKQTTSK